MIYGDNPQDPLGLNVYTPDMAAIMQSSNLYVYCGNNPIMYVDPTGEAWYHWVIGGLVVVAAAAAVVVTAGGALPAVMAVGSVASGTAAATTATTIAAGAFIGSSFVYGGTLLMADYTTVQTFNNSANWGTVGATFAGGLMGGAYGYKLSANNSSQPVLKSADVAKKIVNADRVGTALSKTDAFHRAGSFLSESQLAKGTAKYITGGDGIQRILFQVEGAIDGVKGVFEYILQSDGTVSHQLFTPYQ